MGEDKIRLFAFRGWGSVIAEAILTIAKIPYDIVEVDPTVPGESLDRLRAVNPLGQLPTLALPGGAVLTESAAITLYAADLAPEAGLAPAPGDPDRAAFLRWLAFLVAALYPTFTYGDDPGRWVTTAPKELRASTDAHRVALWKQLEGEAKGPWFLGDRSSALDVFISVMTRWRPGRAKLAEACPKLVSIARAMDERPDLRDVWARNFDG